MGHTPTSATGVNAETAAIYRQRIGDDRVRRVCDHVRGWLLGSGATDVHLWKAAKEEEKRKAKEELRQAARAVIRAKG